MGRGAARSPVLVTYGDVSLTREDLALLDDHGWFNDQLISFFCEWLTRTAAKTHPAAARIVLVPPPLVFFLTFAADPADVASVVCPLRLAAARAVVLFVNSATMMAEAEGTGAVPPPPGGGAVGDHWSVLLWDARARAFSAWDSSCRANAAAARRVAAALHPHLLDAEAAGRGAAMDGGGGSRGGGRREGHRGDTPGAPDGPAGGAAVAGDGGVVVENVRCLPQQRNSSDCGPYACAYAYAIVRQLLAAGSDGSTDLDIDAVRADVATGAETRESLRAIIEGVMAGQEP
ncbi:hypothetical protein MMPV_001988 [Pyropia vietnamensis]